MTLINCMNCGQLIVRKSFHLCSGCLLAQQEDVKKIKTYLSTHPWASMIEVQRMTGVSLKTIRALASNQ